MSKHANPPETYMRESAYDIRTVQELLGHNEVKTTMIYTHVLNRGAVGVRSSVDGLSGSSIQILKEIYESIKTGRPRPNKSVDAYISTRAHARDIEPH